MSAGHVYVLRFSTGVVKVGMSANPKKRLQDHAGSASRFGASITDRWVSQVHESYAANERTLIRWARQREGVRSHDGTEYFIGIDFAEASAFAADLVDGALKTERLIDIDTLSYVISFSPNAIRKMVRQGSIPFIQTGQSLRFDMNAIDEWIAALPRTGPDVEPEPEPCRIPDCEACQDEIPHWWPEERRERERARLMKTLDRMASGTDWSKFKSA